MIMNKPWVILVRRYGGDIRDPSPEQLALAIHEIYVEDLPGMTEADYEEHGAATLRHGFDEGPVYDLCVSRGGTITLEEWADQDYETPLHPERQMRSVPPEMALNLWRLLAEGSLETVHAQSWE